MKTQTQTHEQEASNVTPAKDLGELSFADYERVRRGEVLKSPSAPVVDKATEQKESENSEPSETEEEVEGKADASKEESDSDDGEDESKDAEKDKPKKQGGFQRRIKKLVAERDAERERTRLLEERLARLERGAGDPKSEPAQKKSEPEGKPNPEHFETHAEYVEALTDWKLEQREKAKEAEVQNSKLLSEQERLEKAYAEKAQSFAKKTKDFQEVLEEVEDIPLSPALRKEILESENGPELAYELAKNREEFERLNKLPPTALARAIGKVEARLEASRASSEEKKPEPKKITQAPKPIEPIGSGKAVVAKSITDPDISYAEYEKLRREQMRRRG